MAEPIKFSEEEMNKIKEVQEEYRQKTAVFGQLSFQKFQLERQLDTATNGNTVKKRNNRHRATRTSTS